MGCYDVAVLAATKVDSDIQLEVHAYNTLHIIMARHIFAT